ncbi:MAG: hypothetical protein KDI71_14200 [Xanthomonadales bacterium]|nr:hypothetical protein [Xanthomonadales bacterium]
MAKAVTIIVSGELLGCDSQNVSRNPTVKRWMHRLTVRVSEIQFAAKRVVGRAALLEQLSPGTRLSFVCTEERMRALMGEAPDNGTSVRFSGSYDGSPIIALRTAQILS